MSPTRSTSRSEGRTSKTKPARAAKAAKPAPKAAKPAPKVRRAPAVVEPEPAPETEVEMDETAEAPLAPGEYPAKVRFILDVLDDMKAIDVEVYHVVGKTIVTDYFIICTGGSSTHTSAMADEVRVKCKEQGWRLGQMEGHDNPSWKILDYQDVVLHIFLQETREYYRLEEIWGEGRHVKPPEGAEPVIEPVPLRPRRKEGATAALRKRRESAKKK